jgi:acetoin utilization deacetylase AcuC-like enzyme
MNYYYTDEFVLPLPPGHRFPMAKYRLLRQRVEQLGLVPPGRLLIPPPASDDDLRRAHTADYVARATAGTLTDAEQRRIGFPWSPEMIERSRRSAGATIAAGIDALSDRCAVNLAGGTHHAFADAGEGFCVFNDTAVAARTLQARGLIDRAVILDCDVHQGNGTAAILAGDERTTTMSIHAGHGFPLRRHPADIERPLPDGATDDDYLPVLAQAVAQALELARPDLAFYIAGADPFHGDRLGRLKLTKNGLASRDLCVLEACRRRGLPVAIVMGGGYALNVDDIVDIHATTLLIAQELFAPPA